ncbi:MAG: hypothetical protein ACRENE_23440 [Polyangiaceae bacterium]
MRKSFSRRGAPVMIGCAVLLSSSAVAAADVTKDQCIDANTQAQALRRSGRLAEARQKLHLCADPLCPSVVQSDCTTRLDEIEKAQPTIAFAVKDASGADVSSVTVTCDDEALADHLDGTAFPVDPGQHVFTFAVPGRPPVTRTLLIVEGEKARREVVDLEAAAQGIRAPLAPRPSAPTAPSESSSPNRGGALGTQRVVALVAAGIGVAGLGVGSAFGLVAMSKKNDAQSACPDRCSSEGGVREWSDAVTAANVSTIAFVVGGVGIAGAAVLWFTEPRSASGAGARVGLGLGSMRLEGVW